MSRGVQGGRGGEVAFCQVWMIIGQGPTVLTVGAGGVVWIFSLSPLSLSEMPGGALTM